MLKKPQEGLLIRASNDQGVFPWVLLYEVEMGKFMTNWGVFLKVWTWNPGPVAAELHQDPQGLFSGTAPCDSDVCPRAQDCLAPLGPPQSPHSYPPQRHHRQSHP